MLDLGRPQRTACIMEPVQRLKTWLPQLSVHHLACMLILLHITCKLLM